MGSAGPSRWTCVGARRRSHFCERSRSSEVREGVGAQSPQGARGPSSIRDGLPRASHIRDWSRARGSSRPHAPAGQSCRGSAPGRWDPRAGTHLPPHPHPATPRVAIAAGTARKSRGGPRGGAARGGWGREGVARVQAAPAPSARSSARTEATAAGSAPRGALVSGRAGRERSAPGRCPGPAGRSGMAAGGAGRGVGARRVARLRARPAGRHSDCRRGRFAAALPELSSWRTGWAILPGEMSKVRTTKWVGHKAE